MNYCDMTWEGGPVDGGHVRYDLSAIVMLLSEEYGKGTSMEELSRKLQQLGHLYHSWSFDFRWPKNKVGNTRSDNEHLTIIAKPTLPLMEDECKAWSLSEVSDEGGQSTAERDSYVTYTFSTMGRLRNDRNPELEMQTLTQAHSLL
jgi:hypothetical protein